MTLNDVSMCVCLNGHTFCTSHFVPSDIFKTFGEFAEFVDEHPDIEGYEDHYPYDIVPIENCPICTFTHIGVIEMFEFLRYKYNLTNDVIMKDMRKTFKNYKDMKECCKHRG